jgi:hypothetical protein
MDERYYTSGKNKNIKRSKWSANDENKKAR